MDCFVCEKHKSMNEELILEMTAYNNFIVGHCPDKAGTGEIYLGVLIVEPKRHVKSWADLVEEECKELGLLLKDLNRIMYRSKNIDHVYTWIFGDAVEHMHIWLFPRYSGTP